MRVRRLLIANRGEIAVRIIRACREIGVESVAVYSDVDRTAPHVRLADTAIHIGPATPSESYLRIPKIIDAARTSGADAVHPGYGFLSENAAFADACAKAGITFVGPPADVIARMGSKLAARELMQAAGVPVVPGERPVDQSDEGVRAAARAVGVPLLIKASAGGGGKGMRTVREASELDDAIAAARREAQAAFGDGTLYVERLIERPRHIEVQVMADRHGHVVHLFERECSVQRRHQKVIEETPSPVLTPALRARMGDAAVAAARAAGYVNAGTIEFLLEGAGDNATFYFLEMNTRLQVEHPITEEVTGVDLVRAQLAVASGDALPWTQSALTQRGHAIECRVYAEDPDHGFLPQAGRLLAFRLPEGPGIRVDAGVREGDEVTVHYDPLLAKLIARGETRDAAIDRMISALRRFIVLGIRSNVPFLLRVLRHDRFRRGDVHTGFLAEAQQELMRPSPADAGAAAIASAAAAAAAAAAWRAAQPRGAKGAGVGIGIGANTSESGNASGDASEASAPDPWTILEGWRA